MWASQPKAHKAIFPHTSHFTVLNICFSWPPELISFTLHHGEVQVSGEGPDIFFPHCLKRGLVYSPISPTRAGGGGKHCSWASLPSINGHDVFFEGSRQGWRSLHSHIFSQVEAVAIWRDGYEYKSQWGNFYFSFFGSSCNLKIPWVLTLGGVWFLDRACECGRGSAHCSFLLLLIIHTKWE